MAQPQKLISNAYRTCSMSIPSVEREALGGEHCIGSRAIAVDDGNDGYKLVSRPTGYEVGGFGQDPLDILLAEEDAIEILEL